MAQPPNEFPSLSNQFLVSMPSLDDSYFARSVILMCLHSENGALGIIVNKLTDRQLGDVFEQLSLPYDGSQCLNIPVYCGGPVYQECGLVVHNESGQQWESSLQVNDDLCVTNSRDILSAMARGNGPEKFILSLGYAGWGPGQLENEILQNSWLSTPADSDIIFCDDIKSKWKQAAELIGIDIRKLSTQAGHA